MWKNGVIVGVEIQNAAMQSGEKSEAIHGFNARTSQGILAPSGHKTG
jgi:hypothetical protein